MKREQISIPGTAADFEPGEHRDSMCAYRSDDRAVTLYLADCLAVIERLPAESVDVVWADPPYFLSGGGSTCRGGQRASVDKGKWDAPSTVAGMHAWNKAWLMACRRVLKPTGTLWACGNRHNIHSLGFAMQELGYRGLNDVTWQKPNPPPNLGCRTLTDDAETILWASRDRKARHIFNYAAMRAENGGKQMKTTWRFPPPTGDEVKHGRYPTQKPVALIRRALRASLPVDGTVLDPFMGSGTAGVAARELGAKYIGIDLSDEAVKLAVTRITETPASPRVEVPDMTAYAALCDLCDEMPYDEFATMMRDLQVIQRHRTEAEMVRELAGSQV